MTALRIAGRELQLNPTGHLARFDDWDRDIAIGLAKQEGMTLTECHWAVIEFLRNYYAVFHHPPSPRLIIKGVGAQLTVSGRCTRKTLDVLFPNGGSKQAARLAGLPEHYCQVC
ncbi:MAG: TusE/DsrC/DsvC family sulfur relay protein [Chromatiaceae bacterium]